MKIKITFAEIRSYAMDMNYWGFIYDLDGKTFGGLWTCPTPKNQFGFEKVIAEKSWDTDETPLPVIAREMTLFRFRNNDPESLEHPSHIIQATRGTLKILEKNLKN